MSQPTAPTLLVIPDQAWSSSLYAHLTQNGFTPLIITSTGDSALILYYQFSPRLVLIDLHLPDCNVVELCRSMLVAQPAIKIVLITANDAEPPVAALRANVSGTIQRDFPLTAWPGLLNYILNGGVAFSRSVLETFLAEGKRPQKPKTLLNIGALQIDLAQRQVVYGGRQIQLTLREFALLACLARNADRVVTFDQLLNEAWGFDADAGTATQVRLYIARLRRKLIDDAQIPDFILTKRGVGYRLHSEPLHRTPISSH